MSRSMIHASALSFLAIVLAVNPAAAQRKEKDKDKGGTVVGVIWEYKVVDDRNKPVEEGRFRAFDSKIFAGGREIGTYRDLDKAHVKVVIEKGKLKGKLDLNQVLLKPPTWKGNLVREDGSKYKVTIVFHKD